MYRCSAALALIGSAVLTDSAADGIALFCGKLTLVLQTSGELLATPTGSVVMAVAALLSTALFHRAAFPASGCMHPEAGKAVTHV